MFLVLRVTDNRLVAPTIDLYSQMVIEVTAFGGCLCRVPGILCPMAVSGVDSGANTGIVLHKRRQKPRNAGFLVIRGHCLTSLELIHADPPLKVFLALKKTRH